MGYGYNFNTATPYLAPQPIYFGSWNTTTNSDNSAQSTKKESEEELIIKKKKEEAADAFLKRFEAIKTQAENTKAINEQIKQYEESKKELNTTIEKAKKGKESEDGSIKTKETWAEYKKLPTWKKVLRAAGSMLFDAPMKLAEDLVGYETDKKTGERKWNPIKLGLNAVIAAGCIAACACTLPVSLPVIGATTIGAVASGALLTVGVGAGAYGVTKGVANISDAIKKKDAAKLDHAFQDLGEGIAIGAASMLGLRSTGASLEATAASNSATAIARTASRDPFAAFSNFMTRTEYVKGNNKFSQYFYDSTINAARAIAHNGRKGRVEFENKGFLKSFGKSFKDFIPKLGKSKMEEARNSTVQNIESRLLQIEEELRNPNISKISKLLLKNEKNFLNAQKNEITSTTTRNAWKQLSAKSKSHNESEKLQTAINDLQSNGFVKLNGQRFAINEENLAALQQTLNRSQKLSKEIENLVKIRKATIKKMAYFKKHKAEVEAYTGKTRGNRFGRIYDTSKIQKSDITLWKCVKAPFKTAWNALMIPFKPWNYLQSSPASTAYKVEAAVTPTYAEGFLTTGFIGEALGMGEKTLTTKVIAQNENGEEVEQEVAVTKEILAQLEEQKTQTEQAIAEAKSQLNQLYVA